MSEPIPESIPTSADRRSNRPTKKRALTPVSQQANQVEALFANPDREIVIPASNKAKTLAPPPEIVANVQGSSAGAGSGEFHVYKASRRREYERLRLMDEEVKQEQEKEEFERNREEMKKKDEAKTSKNQKRRAKEKIRKEKAKGAKGAAEDDADGSKDGQASAAKKLKPNPLLRTGGEESREDGAVENGGEVKSMEEEGITIRDDD